MLKRSSIDGRERMAHVKSSGQSYTSAQADFGKVIVVLDDVQGYASGSQIVLRLRDATSAHVSGLKAKIEWRMTDEQGTQVGPANAKAGPLSKMCLPRHGAPPPSYRLT